LAETGDALNHAAGGIVGSRGNLVDGDLAGKIVVED